MKPEPTPEAQGNAFPSTLWTQVLNADQADGATRRAAWEELASRYWKPVHAYVRLRWMRPDDEARDLTQGFFAWMIETGFPARANPSRGRFRQFLKSALENYLLMDLRSRKRQKRGGDRRIVSLESAGAPATDAASPEAAFEKAWRRELLLRAAGLLREKYQRRGKEVYFQVFRACVLEDSAPASHAELAARHGISPVDVNNYLMDAKRTFREILRDLLAETVTGARELDEEYRELFGDGA